MFGKIINEWRGMQDAEEADGFGHRNFGDPEVEVPDWWAGETDKPAARPASPPRLPKTGRPAGQPPPPPAAAMRPKEKSPIEMLRDLAKTRREREEKPAPRDPMKPEQWGKKYESRKR